jgi:branched-chain amino acid transport system ATP-binding protein
MQLRLEGVTVHYGSALAVRNVSVAMEEGSVLSIIGCNGAGKSTIMRAISGLTRISSGQIWFADKRIDRLPACDIVKRGLVQVPEGRHLFPDLTVLANLKLGAFLRRNRAEVDRSLDLVYALFPRLEERRGQKAGTLSGGEQQMLAIGRGMMANPRLLLLDEPSIGLSPIMVQAIAEAIKEINARGIGILLVEQNAGLVGEVAERACVLEVGSVVLDGNIKELMSDRLVQKCFLGT